MILTKLYSKSTLLSELKQTLDESQARVHVKGMTGSLTSTVAASFFANDNNANLLIITTNKENAFYCLNDLETLLDEQDCDIENRSVLLFPTTYRKPYQTDDIDNANVLQRSEVIKQLNSGRRLIVVTYPEALSEKVVSPKILTKHSLILSQGCSYGMDFVNDMLQEYKFDRVDFVVSPGQYAIRGGIVDIFSYSSENPYRIEFFDDEITSIRTFDPVSQLSIKQQTQLTVIPNLENKESEQIIVKERVSLLTYFNAHDIIWIDGVMQVSECIEKNFATATENYERKKELPTQPTPPEEMYCSANEFLKQIIESKIVEYGTAHYFTHSKTLCVESEPQPTFNKQFDLLINKLGSFIEKGYRSFITTSNEQQQKRLDRIFTESSSNLSTYVQFLPQTLNRGFIDNTEKLVCFTDHEIFERYHKYTVRDLQRNKESLTLKELLELKPGDYITHIDHGVGQFSGLEKIEINGKTQEVIRLIYKNNDTLYISIHSLHKISRYVGKEGVPPTLNKLGSNTWQALKQKTKKQVKDIARDLIALYAKRKAAEGFAFSADTYMQHELEASFLYEDTPDQYKATQDVKSDMESQAPMDRLVCGDVGFGKTEVAIRAAFKACSDSKQVAILVPNTILAFQHYNTFCERLKEMPVKIDYLNRFRSTKDKNRIYKELEEGSIDIIIGTHSITNKNIKFKDLGLLIIDEEQKFGVAAKEKLRQMKVNVDCLTLTATPIPRTLQFSLMGARDLSIIQTPPPNRQPIETELTEFNETVIRDAIYYEMSRGGQTFFVNNRVENLREIAGMINRLVPDATVATVHGQMDGKESEKTLLRFLDGEIDVLVATSIVENGLDIPNANTMIINNAQHFGLSDLHQMRGRVGRSNKKAFCYLFIPSYHTLTSDAQKRLKAIEELSTIGSGFNIAMRDLDIRGAGNILGAEQSGFISEIGYDMYHKILNEAIDELKETDFKELFTTDNNSNNKQYVKECVIETDLEVLIPDDYVTNISERLVLYKELNELVKDDELQDYASRLTDRFGPIPTETQELIKTIRLRRLAKEFGIEKLVLKQDKMVCHFSAKQDNLFYKSQNFVHAIKYVQNNPKRTHIKESNGKLLLICDNVKSINTAMEQIQEMAG